MMSAVAKVLHNIYAAEINMVQIIEVVNQVLAK
jgi:hypothetical protein